MKFTIIIQVSAWLKTVFGAHIWLHGYIVLYKCVACMTGP